MIDVLAETLQKLSARRGLLARELATLDEAIAALQRVRDEAPKHGTAAARPTPASTYRPIADRVPLPPTPPAPPRATHCQLESCGKPLPPPSKVGAPRRFCGKPCIKKATRLRARPVSAPAVDDEDPTDAALRRHRELHPVPESSSGMRSRTKARTA